MATTLAPDIDQPLTYQDALGRAGTCRLRCWSKDHVAVVTQLETDTGPSVTNAIEHVAAAVHAIVGQPVGSLVNLNAQGDHWVLLEHYEHGTPSLRPTFDLVTFESLRMRHYGVAGQTMHDLPEGHPEYTGPSWHTLPSWLAWVADVVQ